MLWIRSHVTGHAGTQKEDENAVSVHSCVLCVKKTQQTYSFVYALRKLKQTEWPNKKCARKHLFITKSFLTQRCVAATLTQD